MEIAMPLQRKLIKSDFVRHMKFSEISKFLSVLTDSICYYWIHNWIPKEGLLLISNEPVFFFVSDNEEANHMKSYLHSGKPMSTNEAQRTKNVAWAGKWNCSCERRGAVRETRQGMQEAKYDFMTVSGVYSIVVTVKKQVVAHSVVNFVGSHNFYRRDDFLSIETL